MFLIFRKIDTTCKEGPTLIVDLISLDHPPTKRLTFYHQKSQSKITRSPKLISTTHPEYFTRIFTIFRIFRGLQPANYAFRIAITLTGHEASKTEDCRCRLCGLSMFFCFSATSDRSTRVFVFCAVFF